MNISFPLKYYVPIVILALYCNANVIFKFGRIIALDINTIVKFHEQFNSNVIFLKGRHKTDILFSLQFGTSLLEITTH